MTITKPELKALKQLQKDFDAYFELASAVYRIYNHRDYPTDAEISTRKSKEATARRKLHSSFGRCEQLIYNLLGGKPFMQIPAIPGYRYDIFAEALSSSFRSPSKGDCLRMALDSIDQAVGKAEGLIISKAEQDVPSIGDVMFEDALIKKISDEKTRELCKEFNNIYVTNPNAGALLFRTILLISLQFKMGSKAKDDLTDVLNQAISSNVYDDKHVTRVLKNLQGVPKTLLDATHHSKWILINSTDLATWAQGLKIVIGKTF